MLRYVNNVKVDVPDGYEGVACHHGKPDPNRPSQLGRNWLLTYANFIPDLVSQRD